SLVWLPLRYSEPVAGVYSARKQYQPSALGVNSADVALSLAIETVPPTGSPPLVQSGLEPLAPGPQTKKSTLPATVPFEPLNVATSTTDSPLLILLTFVVPCLTCVSIFGGTQVSRLPSAKSLSCASVSCEERVSARNVPKHGACPPNMSVRLMPPS